MNIIGKREFQYILIDQDVYVDKIYEELDKYENEQLYDKEAHQQIANSINLLSKICADNYSDANFVY